MRDDPRKRELVATVLATDFPRTAKHSIGLQTYWLDVDGKAVDGDHRIYPVFYDRSGRISMAAEDACKLDPVEIFALFRAMAGHVLTRYRFKLAVGNGAFVDPNTLTDLDEITRRILFYNASQMVSPPRAETSEPEGGDELPLGEELAVEELPGERIA